MQDALEATVLMLAQDSDVYALVGDNIFGEEVPPDMASATPFLAVVLRRAAASVVVGGYSDLQSPGIDAFCYGRTKKEAADVNGAVYRALKHMQRQVVSGTLLHWFNPVGTPVPDTDPDTQQPYVRSSWQGLASETKAE